MVCQAFKAPMGPCVFFHYENEALQLCRTGEKPYTVNADIVHVDLIDIYAFLLYVLMQCVLMHASQVVIIKCLVLWFVTSTIGILTTGRLADWQHKNKFRVVHPMKVRKSEHLFL